jgi:hypothetical protein
MDKSNDKKKFVCPECGECFTTKQNLRRHITRKHKDIVFETVVEGPVMTLNETEAGGLPPTLIETDPLISIVLDDRGIEPQPQPEPIPSDDYLIHLRNEYNKYKHLYTSIDNRIRWEEANRNIDMGYHKQRHILKMRFILYKISLLKCNSPIN